MTLKFSPQVFLDDICLQNGSSSDDFIVDELLDFSNEPTGGEEEKLEKSSIPALSAKLEQTHFHLSEDKLSDRSSDFSAAELGVPVSFLHFCFFLLKFRFVVL